MPVAAAAAVAIGKGLVHRLKNALVRADGLAHHQRRRVFQRLADLLAARHLAQAGVARVVGDEDDVAGEEGRVRARKVQQHVVAARHGDDAHALDDGSGHGKGFRSREPD